MQGEWFLNFTQWGKQVWGIGITTLVIFALMFIGCILWKRYKPVLLALLVPRPAAQAVPIDANHESANFDSEIRFPSVDFFLLATLLIIAILLAVLIIVRLCQFKPKDDRDGLYLQVVTQTGEYKVFLAKVAHSGDCTYTRTGPIITSCELSVRSSKASLRLSWGIQVLVVVPGGAEIIRIGLPSIVNLPMELAKDLVKVADHVRVRVVRMVEGRAIPILRYINPPADLGWAVVRPAPLRAQGQLELIPLSTAIVHTSTAQDLPTTVPAPEEEAFLPGQIRSSSGNTLPPPPAAVKDNTYSHSPLTLGIIIPV